MTGRRLVVADQAGEDRQAGGVGRGEGVGAKRGRAQVPDDAYVSVPMGLRPLSSKGATELVELAAGAVHGEHVAVAVGGLPALDQRLERDAVGAVVGLVAIGGEVHLGPLLALADDGIGKAVLARRAEVRV